MKQKKPWGGYLSVLMCLLSVILFSTVVYGEKSPIFPEKIDIRPTTFNFQCGNGYIEISLETGDVKYGDCTPDEGSKAFWEGLKPLFKKMKKEICDDR